MKAGDSLIDVAIYLRGDDLRPDEVSRVLGITPSRCQRKGELSGESKSVVAKIGLWSISAQTESRVISDHLDELFSRLQHVNIKLPEIPGVTDAYLDIFVAPERQPSISGTAEIKLTRGQIDELSRLGLSLETTVAY